MDCLRACGFLQQLAAKSIRQFIAFFKTSLVRNLDRFPGLK